jgi:ubiquinone/menaquinone biosynthesis C-methylase UbiE
MPPSSEHDALRDTVRSTYAAIARGDTAGCGPSCCGSAGDVTDMIGDAYDTVDGYVAEADLHLGCGVPTEHAGLESGQTVVDLGSGAGLDAFVARRIVGDTGRVIGVDFAREMVAKATANTEQLGFDNVSFIEGDIEEIPLDAATADVVLSNCVLNLVPDKARAFAEIHRILQPGGHFTVSDIVSQGPLPDAIRRSAELHAGCVAGALGEVDYLAYITAAGFDDVVIHTRRRIKIPDEALPNDLSKADRAAFAKSGLISITVQGTKPAPISPTPIS